MNKRQISSLVMTLGLVFLMFISGCGSKSVVTEKPIPNLTGEWKQTNSPTKISYQSATISDNVIEIYWVNDADSTKSLYWSGSFIPPTTPSEPYTWDSANDHEKTKKSMLASSVDTKAMKYEKNVLSYEASAFGTTTVVKLKRQK